MVRLIYVTPLILLPLPDPNLFLGKKTRSFFSFTLSTSSSHSLHTILCAISGYPRTLHSLQTNKAKFIRVDLIHCYYQYYFHYIQPLSQKGKQNNTSRAQQYLLNKQPRQAPQPRQSISVTKHRAKTSLAENFTSQSSPSNIHRLIARLPYCANPLSLRARKQLQSQNTSTTAHHQSFRAHNLFIQPKCANQSSSPSSLSPRRRQPPNT